MVEAGITVAVATVAGTMVGVTTVALIIEKLMVLAMAAVTEVAIMVADMDTTVVTEGKN